MLNCEAVVLHDQFARSGSAEGVDRDDDAFVARVFGPAEAGSRFDRNSFLDALGQNRFMICGILLFKEIEARHAYYARFDSIAG